jgi:hypothetical protein
MQVTFLTLQVVMSKPEYLGRASSSSSLGVAKRAAPPIKTVSGPRLEGKSSSHSTTYKVYNSYKPSLHFTSSLLPYTFILFFPPK